MDASSQHIEQEEYYPNDDGTALYAASQSYR